MKGEVTYMVAAYQKKAGVTNIENTGTAIRQQSVIIRIKLEKGGQASNLP